MKYQNVKCIKLNESLTELKVRIERKGVWECNTLKKRVLLYNIDLCLRTKKRGILVQKHEFMFYNLFVKICS